MAGRLGMGGWLVPLLFALLLFEISSDAWALTALRPLDYHAAVVNGAIAGSAFLISDRVAVTNAHVVRGLRPGGTVELTASGGGRARASGKVIAISARMDLALVEVPSGFLPAVPVADAPAVAGARVTAAGIDATPEARRTPPSEAVGEITAPRLSLPDFGPGLVARLPGARLGFSGGPMFDAEGRLVGMVTAIRPSGAPAVAATGRGARPPGRGGDAFVLRAAEIRAEVRHLLRAAR